jgi:hypothetical protein
MFSGLELERVLALARRGLKKETSRCAWFVPDASSMDEDEQEQQEEEDLLLGGAFRNG